ncbi:hypothetical protein [Streptomyces anulatus]|uniref:hypothetical protein n=1 Tax=Streptomyces anulatus TaxID=1892 RepID=UPI002E2FC1EC|nr:hypothetical protein [Streptomyces anulatus]
MHRLLKVRDALDPRCELRPQMPGLRLREAPPVLSLGHRKGALLPHLLQLGAQRSDVVALAVLLLLALAAGPGRGSRGGAVAA